MRDILTGVTIDSETRDRWDWPGRAPKSTVLRVKGTVPLTSLSIQGEGACEIRRSGHPRRGERRVRAARRADAPRDRSRPCGSRHGRDFDFADGSAPGHDGRLREGAGDVASGLDEVELPVRLFDAALGRRQIRP